MFTTKRQFDWASCSHYNAFIMSAMASQITSPTIVYSTVYSGADQRKHQSSASLAFVQGIHLSPVNSPHKWPATRKMFPFDDVIMRLWFPFCFVSLVPCMCPLRVWAVWCNTWHFLWLTSKNDRQMGCPQTCFVAVDISWNLILLWLTATEYFAMVWIIFMLLV